MPRFTAVLFSLSFTLLGASAVRADPIVLASGQVFFHGGGGSPTQPEATGTFYMSWWMGPDAPLSARLFNVQLTPEDVGRAFRETSGSAFDLAVAGLTNTRNDLVKHALTFPDGVFITHSVLENGLFRVSGGPPDLSGTVITALTFRLTDLVVNTDSGSREVRYAGDFMVEGLAPDPIPEPSTLLLMGTGAAVMLRRVRRRGA